MLYQLCTGQLPFKGKDTVSTLVAVAMDNPRTPAEVNPDVPAALSELVMQLLAKNAEDRPGTAQVVVETLQAIETGQATPRPRPKTLKGKASGITRTEPGRRKQGRPAKKRSPLPWLVAGVGVLGVVFLVLLLVCLLRLRDQQVGTKTDAGRA